VEYIDFEEEFEDGEGNIEEVAMEKGKFFCCEGGLSDVIKVLADGDGMENTGRKEEVERRYI